MLKEASSERK